jgi:periplasmic protein TonB
MNSIRSMARSYHGDDPLRLAWVIPSSLLLWAAMLTLFAILLERTTPPRPELAPAEVRIVELPPSGGLRGRAAVKHPSIIAATPRAAARKYKPYVHTRAASVAAVKVHQARPKERRTAQPLVPPSALGIAKKSNEVPQPAGQASAGTEAAPAGVQATGSSAGMGSDSSGARAIYAPEPVIPDNLREEAFQTVAVARFKVTYEGQVKVTLTAPTASPELNELLLETLKKWRFFPAMKTGVPIDSQFDLRIPISVQ